MSILCHKCLIIFYIKRDFGDMQSCSSINSCLWDNTRVMYDSSNLSNGASYQPLVLVYYTVRSKIHKENQEFQLTGRGVVCFKSFK